MSDVHPMPEGNSHNESTKLPSFLKLPSQHKYASNASFLQPPSEAMKASHSSVITVTPSKRKCHIELSQRQQQSAKRKTFEPFPPSTTIYLNRWIDANLSHPYPSREEKRDMYNETGLNKRQLADWFVKARRKRGLEKSYSHKVSLSPVQSWTTEEEENLSLTDVTTNENIATSTTADVVVVATTNDQPEKEPVVNVTIDEEDESKDASKGLSDSVKVHLQKWFMEHAYDPFPTHRDKQQLMLQCGLSGFDDKKKLNGWFSRQRARFRKEQTRMKQSVASIEMSKHEGGVKHANQVVNHKAEKVTDIHAIVSQVNVNIDYAKDPQPSCTEVDSYLYDWMTRPENVANFSPNIYTRKLMEMESGIESRRIESWFYRLRKRMKKQAALKDGVDHGGNANSSASSGISSTTSTSHDVTPSVVTHVDRRQHGPIPNAVTVLIEASLINDWIIDQTSMSQTSQEQPNKPIRATALEESSTSSEGEGVVSSMLMNRAASPPLYEFYQSLRA